MVQDSTAGVRRGGSTLPEEKRRRIVALILAGHHSSEISRRVSSSLPTIRRVAAEVGINISQAWPADPTPEEIAAACAAIRETWTEAERLRRLAVPDRVEWAPPTYAEADLELDVSPAWG